MDYQSEDNDQDCGSGSVELDKSYESENTRVVDYDTFTLYFYH